MDTVSDCSADGIQLSEQEAPCWDYAVVVVVVNSHGITFCVASEVYAEGMSYL